MSDRLEELTSGWRPHHHEGWAQRWLTHMLGQVECVHDWQRASCDCPVEDQGGCCFGDTCRKCKAAI